MGPGLHVPVVDPNSLVQRLDPRAKILLVIVFVVVVVSTPPNHLSAYVAYAGLLCWGAALAHLPLRSLFGRAAAVLPFSVLAALWLPFLGSGETISLFGGHLELSVAGSWLLLGVIMKSLLGAAALIWLAMTTPFAALLCGLRGMGVPIILVDVLTLTYRYLFVLVEEASRLRRAAAARGYRPRWLGQALLIGRLIGQLFVRAYERAERVHRAMLLRGYRGRMPVSEPLAFGLRDLVALVLAISAVVLVRGVLR